MVVDSGDLFFPTQRVSETLRARSKAQAEVIVDAFNRIGCAGLNIGDRDLAAGREVIESLARRAEFPFLSANILDPKTKRPLFRPYVVAEVAGRRIGLVGLLSPRSRLMQDPGEDPEFEIGDPVEAAKSAVAALTKERVHVILLLSQLLDDEVTAVIEAAPAIDMVLGSQNPSHATMLGEIAGRPHATNQVKGKFLGVTSLYLQAGSRGVVERDRARSIVAAVGNIDRRIRQQEQQWARFAARPDVQQQRIAFFQREIERQLAERARLVADLESIGPADPKKSFVEFELAPMNRQIADDPQVLALVEAFKADQGPPTRAIPNPNVMGTRAGGLKPIEQAPLRRMRERPRLPKGVAPAPAPAPDKP